MAAVKKASMLVTEVSTTVTPVFLRTSPVSSWWMIMDALFTSLSSSTLAVSFQASVYPQKCCGCYVPVPVSWVQILLGAAFLFSGLFGSKVDPAAVGPSCIGRSAEGNIWACLVSWGCIYRWQKCYTYCVFWLLLIFWIFWMLKC